MLLYTKSCILAAPVRLELTTHGLTASFLKFLKSLQAFILKGLRVFQKIKLPLGYHFFKAFSTQINRLVTSIFKNVKLLYFKGIQRL